MTFKTYCPSCTLPVRCPFCNVVLEKTIGEKGGAGSAFVAVYKCGTIIEFIREKDAAFTQHAKQNCKKEM